MSLDKDKEYVVFPTPVGPVTIISLAIGRDSLLVHNAERTGGLDVVKRRQGHSSDAPG
tara:strand:- start:724 stop:897 length:174 start_codon:yes stop_codon:yes gene_type:complete